MSVQGRALADAAPALPLGDLSEEERRVIRLLRLWRDGPTGGAEAWIMACDAACSRLEALLRLFATSTAHPLPRRPAAREEATLACGLAAPAATAQGAARPAGELCALPDGPVAPRSYLIAGRPVTPRAAGAR